MKKVVIAILALTFILFACIYIFIPSTINGSVLTTFKAPINGVYRCTNNETMLDKWMPATIMNMKSKIATSNSSTLATDINFYNEQDTITSTISMFNIVNDSIAVQWKFSIDAGNNPFTRLKKYNEAVDFKKTLDSVLHQLKIFASNDDNIYGLHVQEARTKDTLVITTKTNLNHYPDTKEIYALISHLQQYANRHGAKQSNHPMYNITKLNGDSVRLMVGLPVNKSVPENNSVTMVKMVKGRFLVCEIKGGDGAIHNAMTQMKYYFPEHHRTAMAIPFIYLITDRTVETDTTKWVSEMYSPVF